MGFDFTGHVLRAPRVSPANAQTTGEVTNGVVRSVEPVPAGYTLDAAAPPLVDVRADMYRAAILDAPGTSPVEYCVWAENTSNLALLNDPSWAISQGTGSIPLGSLAVSNLVALPVEVLNDGSDRVVVQDDGGRSIGRIAAIVIARGDHTYDDEGWTDPDDFAQGREGSEPYGVLLPTSEDQDARAGVVRLTRPTLTLLGGAQQVLTDLDGGLSALRGDTIVEVWYSLAPSRFWWTRNDRYQTRFGWKDATQRWEPYKGGHVINLGILKFDEKYTLSPKPKGLVVGTVLPGDGSNQDDYAMIRAGNAPGAVTSLGLGPGDPDGFLGIQVKNDRDVEGFDFTTAALATAVVGKTSGVLVFNPAFVERHAGKTVWYVSRDFDPESDGVVGDILGSDKDPLYISPIPSFTDFPLLSLGSRHFLTPTVVRTEADLNLVGPGEVAVAMSTGRVKLSQSDIDQADPDKPTFSKHFLGEKLLYSGLALNGQPQPVRREAVVASVISGGEQRFFIPDAQMLPTEWALDDPTRGLGVSGVLNAPDGTGVVPSNPAAAVPIRPGGDNLGDVADGRVRQVVDGVSEAVVFSRAKALSVVVVGREEDLPSSPIFIPSGTAYITRQNVTFGGSPRGSQVMWGRSDAREFGNDPVYFVQTDFCPATHTRAARLISKTRFVFRFPEPVTLYFAIDGNSFQYDPTVNLSDPSKGYTAEEVAADLGAFLGANGTVYAINGSVVIESVNSGTGSVEIGWGTGQVKDLGGAAALGFIPGWRAVGGVDNWLPDSGISFGMPRSPINKDRTRDVPDFNAFGRLEDETLSESVPPAPFVFFDAPPLQDVVGYDEGVFFNLKTIVEGPDGIEIVDKPLEHFEDIVHRFGEQKFLWVERDTQTDKVQKAVSTLGFGRSGVVPESLLGAPGIGGGLYISQGGSFVFQKLDEDFLLPQGGTPGTALLIERFGDSVVFGGRGSLTAGSTLFTDPDADFVAPSEEQATNPDGSLMFDPVDGSPIFLPIAREGYRLKLTSGPAEGSYLVTSVEVNGTDLQVEPTPPVGTDRATPWELFRGFTENVYDPSLVADQVYENFNHLPEEPMKVRTLSKLGPVPADAAAQAAGRLKADMEAAITRGREIALRYGLVAATATNTATMVPLGKTELGSIANNSLVVPSGNNARFTSAAFVLLVGIDRFPATPVANFSADPPDAAGVVGQGIEFLTADGPDGDKGLLKFGSALLADYAEATVHYVETFLAPASLAALTVEYDPETGDLNLSTADMTAFTPETAWFVERMITEGRLDVAISPMSGACGFNEPVKEFQAVEFEYFLADVEGKRASETPTVEFLPVFVRDEIAERVDEITFEFNLTGREIDIRVEPSVYVGAMLQNYGATVDLAIMLPDDPAGRGVIKFLNKKIPAHVPVRVTFASFEANGGERAYTASQRPIYRPPFFIKANKDNFGLRSDRTGDLQVGQMLRIGNSCHYVRRTLYFPDSDITRVDIFPATVDEVGSRSPGGDVLTLITAEPVTTVVDPDGQVPVATAAPAGFMQELPISQFPFEPLEKGQTTVTFVGDLTKFAIPGHILEMGGMPFTVANAKLNEDGTRTKITTTAPFAKGLNANTSPTVKLSYRPIYPPGAREFLGLGPVLDTGSIEVVLFGETDDAGAVLPGRTLVRDIEYALDTSTGAVKLLEPVQKPLGPGQRLFLYHTRIRTLRPFLAQGVIGFPRTFSSFLFNTLPSKDNGIEGGLLSASFTYRAPDTFYCRAATLTQFLGEAVKQAVSEIKAKQPAGGSIRTVIPGTKNWEQGRVGLLGEGRHLADQDRAARTFLDFYNSAVVAFEQIPEAISGGFVGDRDGKFRFFIGKGLDYPTPGYEDDITGLLTPRFVWGEIWNFINIFADLVVFSSDRVTSPFETTLTDSIIDGPPPESDLLNKMVRLQKPRLRNDVDDVVLLGIQRPTFEAITSYPYFRFRAGGPDARRMGESHALSRLFPTQTKAFLITYPGIGANEAAGESGVYARSRVIDDEEKSTYRTEIGQLANPAIGNIENVTQAQAYKRRARARIWDYFPNGIPQGSFANVASGAPADIPAVDIVEPCVVAFPVLLSDVPMHPSTGWPDVAQLLSQGGTVPDAVTGDPELATPGFLAGDQINWGQPDGKTYPGLDRNPITINPFGAFGGDRFTALYVHDVQHGCVIRFQDKGGGLITSPEDILVGTAPDAGTPAHQWPIGNGDTLYVVAPSGGGNPFGDPQNPTAEEIAALPEVNDTFDVRFTTDGKLIDITLPSFNDPTWFGLKEIFGQNPPPPLGHLEADVNFVAFFQNPLELPALKGEHRDDTGDFQIPYLRGGNTELQRFTQISLSLPSVVIDEYPDEIFGVEGEIVGVADVGALWDHGGASNPLLPKEAAALMTLEDVFPKTTNPAAVGVADLRPYDLLLVEVDSAEAAVRAGSQGILSVGSVVRRQNGGDTQSIIKPPRFVTQTTPPPRWQVELGDPLVANDSNITGTQIRYSLLSYNTFLNVPAYTGTDPQTDLPVGVRLTETDTTGDGNLDRTIIDFDDPAITLTLHNGLAVAGVGGLNDFWSDNPADPQSNNEVQVAIFARTDDLSVNGPGANRTHGQLLVTLRFFKNGGVPSVEALPAGGAGNGPIAVAPGDVTFGTGPNLKQIWINVPGIIDWGPGAGLPNEWYLPHTDSGPGPGRTLSTIYGFEYTFSALCNGVDAVSATGWISSDRLTFNDVLDMRGAMVRGTVHPQNAGTGLATTLRVEAVDDASGLLTVNDVNGGAAMTFLPQSGATPPFVGGTWNDRVNGTSPEYGSLEVPAWEADGVTQEILGSNIRFAAQPGFTVIPGGPATVGVTESKDNTDIPAAERALYDDRVTQIDASTDVEVVEKGDILIIDRRNDPIHWATTKAGTWVIRYGLNADTIDAAWPPPVAGSFHYREFTPVVNVGGNEGLLPPFPKVKQFDPAANTLTVDTTTGFGFSGGRVYVILEPSAFGDPATPLANFQRGLFSASFASLTSVSGGERFNGLADYRWADGTAVSATDLTALAVSARDKRISGFTSADLQVRGPSWGLPDDPSVVGWHSTAGAARWIHGVRFVNLTTGISVLRFSADAGTIVAGAAPAAGQISVQDAVGLNGHTFVNDDQVPLYPHVPIRLYLNLTTDQWDGLNNPAGHGKAGANTDCLIPQTEFRMEDPGGPTPGFAAQGGIFLEAKYPQPTRDLGALGDQNQHVVDADHTLLGSATPQTGMRSYQDFSIAVVAPTSPEQVHFTVRRARRWHEFSAVTNDFQPLRYAYEIRRGRITGYSTTSRGFALVDAAGFTMQWNTDVPPSPSVALAPDIWNDGKAYTGTNLGPFNSPDVNLHPGDMFRLLDENGRLLEQVEVVAVVAPGTIKLAIPGLRTKTPAELVADGGLRFEIWLRQAPVPHEQSMEQLLDLVTYKEVHRTFADYAAEQGGFTPSNTTGYDNAVNRFSDDHPQTGVTVANGGWAARGVKKGDILIIDPAGTIPQAEERGREPVGDIGVQGRAGWVAGTTDDLDDNRGFYRISGISDTVDPPELTVNPVHTFAGDGTTDVVFPDSGHPNFSDLGYTIYPTVSQPGWTANGPSSGKEGQNDLRPSQTRSPSGSYQIGYASADGDIHSIRPVSYRIIRPNQMFSEEAIDFILTVRERMLSWIEVLSGVMQERRLGPYFRWMRDMHPHDLGDLGLLANAFVQSLVGMWNHSPYMNSDNCLSILGRRFWILDPTLDRMEPTNANPVLADPYRGQDTGVNPPNVAFPGAGGPYTAYTSTVGGAARPVLPDRVEEILNNSDRLRPIRYIWLAYRTHRLLGTLVSLARFEADLPERLEEQRQLALLQESTDKAGMNE